MPELGAVEQSTGLAPIFLVEDPLPEGDEGVAVDDGVLAGVEAVIDGAHPHAIDERAGEQEEGGEQSDALDQEEVARGRPEGDGRQKQGQKNEARHMEDPGEKEIDAEREELRQEQSLARAAVTLTSDCSKETSPDNSSL